MPSSKAKVTIVVVPREQFGVAVRSLDSIYAHTEEPFDLVYVDGRSPAPVAEILTQEPLETSPYAPLCLIEWNDDGDLHIRSRGVHQSAGRLPVRK